VSRQCDDNRWIRTNLSFLGVESLLNKKSQPLARPASRAGRSPYKTSYTVTVVVAAFIQIDWGRLGTSGCATHFAVRGALCQRFNRGFVWF